MAKKRGTDRNLLQNDRDIETEKTAAIGLCRRRIDALVNRYRDDTISREDYLQDKARYKREIAQ